MSPSHPIPGPPRSLLDFTRFRRDPITFLRSMATRYGDISKFTIAGQELVLINDVDRIHDILVTDAKNFVKGRGLERSKLLLGEGLLTSEGELHLRQRRMIQPAFHRQRIAEYGRVMAGIAADVSDRWTEGCTVDISEEAANITLTIVGKTLFDSDLSDEASEIGAALADSLRMFNLLSLPFGATLMRLPLPSVQRFKRARARLDATIYRMIAERRDAGDRGDLLSMLLSATDSFPEGSTSRPPEAGKGALETTGRMSDVQVRDEAMTLFIAGHETTANALAWTIYLLALNLDVERKLLKELTTTLRGRLPTVDDIPNLPYTRQVISESLRLYPPAWIIGRRALQDYPIGDYVIRKDAVAFLAPVVTHVDSRYWPDPMRFDPGRWAVDAGDRPKFAYFPFGSGARVCIGEQFAWMEMILVLATLLQRWQFTLIPGHIVTPKPIITLRAKDGILTRLKRRIAKPP